MEDGRREPAAPSRRAGICRNPCKIRSHRVVVFRVESACGGSGDAGRALPLAADDGVRCGAAAPPRQRAVVALAAAGLTDAAIAAQLESTAGTDARDLARIARRLGVRTRADVVAWAVERRS